MKLNSFSARCWPIKTLDDILTSLLLFYHNESMKMSCLICMVCDFVSHEPRDITIGISIIGYSIT